MLYFFNFYFGAIVGSFIYVCILRLPKGEDIVFKKSYCERCNKKIEPYKKENITDEPEIQLETLKKIIPKDTTNIIEEAENSLKNTTNEILINTNYDEDLSNEVEKPKSKNLNYGLGMLLLLTTVIAILFFFNKFQIIDLNYNLVTNSVFSLIDSILK